MDNIKIVKFKSDYDPDCILTLIKDMNGDIIADINKRMETDGTGQFRIAMSGGQLRGNRKAKIVRAFEKIIDAFNEQENEIAYREQHKKIDMGEIRRKISDNIKSYRFLRGFTQQELADEMGLSRFAITRYESGKYDIPFEKLYEIADILGGTVFDFLP
jgi:DNA-binding XRE family transcriptional regulator